MRGIQRRTTSHGRDGDGGQLGLSSASSCSLTLALSSQAGRGDPAAQVVTGSPCSKTADIVDLPDLLRPGDALVLNDTRVIRAALQGERMRGENRAAVSFNLHKRLDEHRWLAFARPAKRLAAGDRIRFGHDGRVCLLGTLDATVARLGEAGEVELAFSLHGAYLDEAIEALGDPPLPPYIAGKRAWSRSDAERYQTVYARREGAVAAPTAGLHFTDGLFAALDAPRRHPPFRDAARRRRHLPSREGGGHLRAPHACGVGRDRR